MSVSTRVWHPLSAAAGMFLWCVWVEDPFIQHGAAHLQETQGLPYIFQNLPKTPGGCDLRRAALHLWHPDTPTLSGPTHTSISSSAPIRVPFHFKWPVNGTSLLRMSKSVFNLKWLNVVFKENLCKPSFIYCWLDSCWINGYFFRFQGTFSLIIEAWNAESPTEYTGRWCCVVPTLVVGPYLI